MSVFGWTSKKIVSNVKTEAVNTISPMIKGLGTLLGLSFIFLDDLKSSEIKKEPQNTTVNNIIIFDKKEV